MVIIENLRVESSDFAELDAIPARHTGDASNVLPLWLFSPRASIATTPTEVQKHATS